MTITNKKNIALITIFALTLAHWIILIFHIPFYDNQAGWFWIFIPKPAGSLLSITTLITLIALAVLTIIKLKQYPKTSILLLICLGTCFQFNFAFLEGRGIGALSDRIIYTGHAEFAKVAVKQDSIMRVLSDYEELLTTGELGIYPNTKAPGTLFFYMLTKKVAEINATDDELRNKAFILEKLRSVITYTWPLFSYLILIPIFFLTKSIAGRESAILACGFYLTIPSINLMTLHTDQVIYPLLFILPVLFSTLAGKNNDRLLIFFSGGLIYFAMWFNLALIFSVIFVFGISFLALLERSDFSIKDCIKFYICLIAGFLCIHVLFEILFNYNFLIRYDHATKFHFSVKGWEGGLNLILHFGILNLVEFFVWIGLPVTFIVFLLFYDATTDFFTRKKFNFEYALAILLPVTLLIIALVGKTKAETARLWLFLVPYTCIVAAQYITKKFGPDAKIPVTIVLILQFGTTYLTKINQDFF